MNFVTPEFCTPLSLPALTDCRLLPKRHDRSLHRQQRPAGALYKRLKNEEAADCRLDEKENCVELMISLAPRERSSNQPGEIKDTAYEVYRSQGKKMWYAFQK